MEFRAPPGARPPYSRVLGMSVRVFAAVYRREPALLRARVEAAAGLAERIQEQYVP